MAEKIGKSEFEEKVLKCDKLALVDFYSDSCVACKKLSPALGQAENALKGQYYFYKVNTNFEEEITDEYEILSKPTLIVFQSGRELGRRAGVQKAEELTQWLQSFLK
jgi:Thioredoxin domain-containing protein